MAEEVKQEEREEEEAAGVTGAGEEAEKQEEGAADAVGAALQAVAEKEARIEELVQEVEALKAAGDSLMKGLDEAKATALAAEARGTEFQGIALAKYREALIEGHPDIPNQLIRGGSIEELYHSVDAGKEVVAQIREAIAQEVGATIVPAGAPERNGISKLEGLSPREKIAAGINS